MSRPLTEVACPLMRYHGGKYRLAPWIISHFPPHRIYVEPFGGAASVLMYKPRSQGEVYNDLDGEMVNVMRVLQDATLREQLTEVLTFTPYARAEFERAAETTGDPIERARRILIRAQMGFGSAGATKGTTGFRRDVKSHAGGNQRHWAHLPERLQYFGRRLQGVLLENRPALQVMRDHDTPDTLFYLDSPDERRLLPAGDERCGSCRIAWAAAGAQRQGGIKRLCASALRHCLERLAAGGNASPYFCP